MNNQETLQQIEKLIALGHFDAALSECRSLISQAPDDVSGWIYIGQLLLRRGELVGAESAFRQVATLAPRYATAWNWLSIAQRGQDRLQDAEASARQAIAIDPAPADHWTNLANALAMQAKWHEAATAFRESLARRPDNAEIWCDLGVVEHSLHRLEAAQAAYERSLAIEPGRLGTLTNWAYLLIDRSEPERALPLLNEIVRRDPGRVSAWVAIGNAYQRMSDLPQADQAYRHALRIEPGHAEATHNLEQVRLQKLAAEGMAAEAIEQLSKTLAIEDHRLLHTQFLQTLSYKDGTDAADLLRAHRQWAAKYADPISAGIPRRPPRREGGPLRLGFVSADFGQHPLAFLGLPALEQLDKNGCSIAFYSDRWKEDEYTVRLRAIADLWRQTSALTDEELAEQIRRDEIDVLFDLMGHTGRRMLLFARRPAPVQVTWMGYVGTTGLCAMDYLLADRFHIPPGEEDRYVETVLRMPNDYVCYGPPHDAPEVGLLPAKLGQPFTFGCFNNPAKYSPATIAAWAEILHRVPSAKLLLKYRGLDQPQFADDIHARFAQRHIPPQRVVLEGKSPLLAHLAAYNRVDLALDTQPYSGGLTTCEALWMGVPVVTFPGKTFASRHSTSHMNNAGYPDFVANDPDGYVKLAVEWANRLDELTLIRSQMRERVRNSHLCDAPTFARDFLALITQVVDATAPQ